MPRGTKGQDVAAELKKAQDLMVERAQKEREEWLRLPRLHTAVFQDVWNDQEVDLWTRSKSLDVNIINPGAAERRQKLDAIREQLGWSEQRLADFQRLVVEYGRSSNTAVYLKIRRTFPEVEIQIPRFGGIEFVFAFEDKLKGAQISPELVVDALDSSEPAIDALCLRLLELLAQRDALPKSGPGYIDKRRAAISDALVNYLILIMLEGYDRYGDGSRVPASLIVLIRRQLSGESPDLYEEQRAHDKRMTVALLYAEKLDVGERLSVSDFAKTFALPRSTAGRWLASEEFQRSVTGFRGLNKIKRDNLQRRPSSKRPTKK
jgi:hypothetical protein